MRAIELAKFYSSRYRETFREDMDEMKMHKLLYLAQRESLIRYGMPLFDEGIYAFKHGPVIKEIRSAFQSGDLPCASAETLMPYDRQEMIDDNFKTYAAKESWSLSRLTHCEESWKLARRDPASGGGDRLMPVDSIRRDADRIRERRRRLTAMKGF